jgi:hypothetical protein
VIEGAAELAEGGVDRVESRAVAAEAVGRGGDGVGIAVEADEARGGEALQESGAVAAAAEGDVDEEAITDAAGEGRGEGGAHLLDQDRLVVAPLHASSRGSARPGGSGQVSWVSQGGRFLKRFQMFRALPVDRARAKQ